MQESKLGRNRVSIPLKPDSTYALGCIKTNYATVICFPFPSSGKAHVHLKEFKMAKPKYRVFPFPSSGKAHVALRSTKHATRYSASSFHSLQAGKHMCTHLWRKSGIFYKSFHSLQAGKAHVHLPYFRPHATLDPKNPESKHELRGAFFFNKKNGAKKRLNPYQY